MKKILLGVLVIFIVMQLVPYGRNHVNPQVVSEPKWDSAATEMIFMRVCGDCHSHKTKWPWYSNIAPLSWSIQHHVDEGREHFNISMWGIQKKNEGEDAVEEVEEGEMPLKSYLLAHPEARLNKEDKAMLIEGLRRTFGEKDHD